MEVRYAREETAMNLIYNLMDKQGSRLIEQLTGAGLNTEQADGFLPDALKSVMGGLEQVDVQALLETDTSTQTNSLMDKIDIPSLADNLGGDSGLASNGLQAIIPLVLGFLKDNPAAAGLISMLSNKNRAGLAGLAKGFFH
jgi:hypothetical protein